MSLVGGILCVSWFVLQAFLFLSSDRCLSVKGHLGWLTVLEWVIVLVAA